MRGRWIGDSLSKQLPLSVWIKVCRGLQEGSPYFHSFTFSLENWKLSDVLIIVLTSEIQSLALFDSFQVIFVSNFT